MLRNAGLIALSLLVLAGEATGVEVEAMRLWAGPDSTRVVLDVDAPVEHRLFVLRNPDRVVVDVPGARLTSAASIPNGAGYVRRIRHGVRDGTDLRIVLDIDGEVQPRSFVAVPNERYGHRLVVDLLAPARAAPAVRTAQSIQEHRDVVVAIDAGHGGEDPGAIGRRGTREKHVVMEIARRLATLIEQEPGMRALLIRDGDYSVSLRRRMEIAREHRADLFVSVHADAFRDVRAGGSSVYILSENGASSEAARWLAERENAADLVGGVSLDDKDDLLASVLLDLSQTAALSASLNAAQKVIEALADAGRIRKREVQQAGFLVLKSPDIPSILIEVAFVSNPDEERRLRNGRNQERWARAILSGVREYFMENAPTGTLLAAIARAQPVDYVIARGDTLSGIAERFRVSVRELRAVNRLSGDRIRTGQTLRIPVAAGS